LVAGSDVPWIPAANRPSPGARIYVLDIDPIKEQMTLWHVPAARYARADLATALRQVTASLREQGGPDAARVTARGERLAAGDRGRGRRDRLRPGGGPAGGRRRGRRRLRGHRVGGRQAPGRPQPGARRGPPRPVRRDQRPCAAGRPAARTSPPGPGRSRAERG